MSRSYKKAIFKLFLFLPCLALAQYPKAMDFSKLYQGKIDSLVVIHRTGWTRETSWPEAPEEEHITERRKLLPLSEGNRLLRILRVSTWRHLGQPILESCLFRQKVFTQKLFEIRFSLMI